MGRQEAGMIQVESRMKVADNTGAKSAAFIGVLGKKTKAGANITDRDPIF